MYRSVLIALATLSMMVGSRLGQAATRHLEPKDYFAMRWASDPQINRAGTLIVYGRASNDIWTDRQVESLWLLDIATGRQTPVASRSGALPTGSRPWQASPRRWSPDPRWSPDGTRIAFLNSGKDGHTQIFIHWIKSGLSAPVTELTEAPSELSWSPDGKQIAFLMFTPEAAPTIGTTPAKPNGATWAPGPIVVDTINFRADGEGLDAYGVWHLFVVSAEGGAPRQLTFGDFTDAGPLSWSPDGKYIFFSSNHNSDWRRQPETWWNHAPMDQSIYRVDVADGSLRQISHDVGPFRAPAVSPDGKHVAFIGFHDDFTGDQDTRLYVAGIDGSDVHEVSGALDRSIDEVKWADSSHVLIRYVDEGVTKIASMSLDGRMRPVASNLAGGFIELPYSGGHFSASARGSVAYAGGGPNELPDVYFAHDGKSRRLTDLNSELFRQVSLGTLSPLAVKSSFDGRPIGAWELVPPGFDRHRKYPLILEIHGGPYASYGPVFSLDDELYAAAGYVVVYANPRGSTSYGQAFANLIYNDYPSHDYDDLMSAVDAAIQRGGVDPNNLFVTGASGGGVLTAWTVGKTHRFRAAVTQRPVVDWTSWMLTSDMTAFGARYWFKKLPWEDQKTYWKLSPLSLVGNVTTPTMVVVGTVDLRTPDGEAEQFYQALQLRNIPTELYYIPDASHVMIRPSQALGQNSAILAWFARYRKTATE